MLKATGLDEVAQESVQIGTGRGTRTSKSQWRRKNKQKEGVVTSLKAEGKTRTFWCQELREEIVSRRRRVAN